jgi:hypothetical protein
MNGFKKNKNGTTKRTAKPDTTDYQASGSEIKEHIPDNYQNTKDIKKNKH